jgi:ribosome maturation factor RimP
MQAEIIQKIWARVEPIAAEDGLEVVDIEFHREGHGTTLRVYLDQAGGGRIDLDALTRVSRQLGDVLDVYDFIPGPYNLEVSSPGVNRRLRRPEHFRRYVGQRVRIRASEPINGRRSFLGTLEAVEAEGVQVRDDGGQHEFVPFDRIAHANYEYDFGSKRNPPKGGARRQHATGTQSRY